MKARFIHIQSEKAVILLKISKQNAEHYIWGNNCDGWYLVKNKNLSIIHERMPANTFEVRHYHHHAQQFFFVLSGTAVLEVDGEEIVLHSLEGKEVPPHIPHQMANRSNENVEFWVISQSTSREDRVLELNSDLIDRFLLKALLHLYTEEFFQKTVGY